MSVLLGPRVRAAVAALRGRPAGPAATFGYPVSLELTGRTTVVIGEEAVTGGKADGLLLAGALVTVIAETPAGRLDELAADPRVTVRRRGWRPADLDGAFLCVAARSDEATQAAIYAAGRERGVLMNVMDDIPHCDFATPAIVRRGHLAIAISTGGRSPALARRLRELLGEQFGPEWGPILELLGETRAETLPALPDYGERARRWHAALDLDELRTLVAAGAAAEAKRRLVERLLG